MKKKWIAVIASSVVIMGIAITGASFAESDGNNISNGTIRIQKQSESQFPSMATISMDQAVQQALAAIQGQVLKAELEDENGFLVYGVELVTAENAIVDVKVDAGSGMVLAMNQDKADNEDHDSNEENDRDQED